MPIPIHHHHHRHLLSAPFVLMGLASVLLAVLALAGWLSAAVAHSAALQDRAAGQAFLFELHRQRLPAIAVEPRDPSSTFTLEEAEDGWLLRLPSGESIAFEAPL